MAGIALEIPASIPRWELFFCGYQFVGNESPIELKLWRRSDSETAGMYLMKYALRKGENLGCTDTDQRGALTWRPRRYPREKANPYIVDWGKLTSPEQAIDEFAHMLGYLEFAERDASGYELERCENGTISVRIEESAALIGPLVVALVKTVSPLWRHP